MAEEKKIPLWQKYAKDKDESDKAAPKSKRPVRDANLAEMKRKISEYKAGRKTKKQSAAQTTNKANKGYNSQKPRKGTAPRSA